MRSLLQINPVLRVSTSTGRIMQEIGVMAQQKGWKSYIAYSKGRDGIKKPCQSQIVPVGGLCSTVWHGVETRLLDRHGLASVNATKKFVRQIERIHPDIVHIHNIHGYFLNYKILFDYLSHSGIPVVWTVHDCWLYTGHCYYYSYIGCDKWQTGCGHCPQRGEFPASLLFDRSARNFADKKAAFTSMPRDKFVIVPVSRWIRNEMSLSFLKEYDFRVILLKYAPYSSRVPYGADQNKQIQFRISTFQLLLNIVGSVFIYVKYYKLFRLHFSKLSAKLGAD